jgi:lipopolysaccharide biosynthesis protein
MRFSSLIVRSLSIARQYGLRAFLGRVKDRLFIQILQWIYKPSPNSIEALYSSYINTAKNQDNNDYVPISDGKYPVEDASVRLIAFYLPQFHPVPENDEWWGKGFTEWTNVSKAVPQFVGHYQPRLPGELGFYDLRVPEVQKRQIELARKYGIYGFAFYFYWFNGKRLLDKPMDMFFSDKDNKFPFCIFWANENWTRRWDGREEDILIAQNHTPESDFAFIKEVAPFFRDERYIRINGMPVLLVYRVQLFPEPRETAKRWRKYCRDVGIGEIYLVAAQANDFMDPRGVGFDAALEFPPHNNKIDRISTSTKILNPTYQGQIFHYQDFANFYSKREEDPGYELFKTVAPGWDNEPRKPGRGATFAHSTPEVYQEWLKSACLYTMKKLESKRVVFINAWNEWGEGAYLEPDRRFGYAYLQATKNALIYSSQTTNFYEKKELQ